ncbi:MAG: MBL fold metallo-hydrolase [Chitinispirillia bacterium]|nr:MBL fold metallo-hydrolase [Chitinispirillia bacterium]MCL2267772.1 MBL fold metallo-hydrolase [Chitinispirillia bacterium]
MRLKPLSFAVMLSMLSLNAFAAKPISLEGGFEVTVFDEVPGRDMGVELFEGGPMTKEQRLAFMPGGKAPAAVNVFVVKTPGKTYLIDAGFGNAVKDKRVDPARIDAVLITHAHGDHIGGLLKEDGTVNFTKPVFISKTESDYWLDPKTQNSDLPKKVAKAYEGRYKTFAFGDTLAPGIVAIGAEGHTPGHTAFLIGTGKKKLLIAADFLHAAALQFPNPEECASFDVDRKKSVETRKKLIQMCIDNGWLIGGMHIPGGIGTVKSNGKGGFEFTPHK